MDVAIIVRLVGFTPRPITGGEVGKIVELIPKEFSTQAVLMCHETSYDLDKTSSEILLQRSRQLYCDRT